MSLLRCGIATECDVYGPCLCVSDRGAGETDERGSLSCSEQQSFQRSGPSSQLLIPSHPQEKKKLFEAPFLLNKQTPEQSCVGQWFCLAEENRHAWGDADSGAVVA